MESINLYIKQFGRIRNAQLSINKLMVFSGESGLGKSYLAMLSHYFFYVLLSPFRMNKFILDKGYDYMKKRDKMRNSGVALTIDKKELEKWLAQDAIDFVKFLLGHGDLNAEISVELPSVVPPKINFVFQESVEGFVDAEDTYIILTSDHLQYRVKDTTERLISDESPFAKLLRAELTCILFGSHSALDNYFILPPSRGASMTEKVIPRTGLYTKFSECIDSLIKKPLKVDSDAKTTTLIHEILEGNIRWENDGFIYESKTEPMPISAAAASIREAAVFELIAEKTQLDKDAILIEEPEAHLHPLKQRQMADLIACMLKAGACMQVTTHSDYFLRRLNEIIMLSQLYGTFVNDSNFSKLCVECGISEDILLNATDINSYVLQKQEDGTSSVIKQDIQEGIPFTSFGSALEKSIRNLSLIRNFTQHDFD